MKISVQQRIHQREALAVGSSRTRRSCAVVQPVAQVMGGPGALSVQPVFVPSPVEMVDVRDQEARMAPELLISASPRLAFLPLLCAL